MFLYNKSSFREDNLLQKARALLDKANSNSNAIRYANLKLTKEERKQNASRYYEEAAKLFLNASEEHISKYPSSKFNYESCVNSAKDAYSKALEYSPNKGVLEAKKNEVFFKRINSISAFLSGNEYLKRAKFIKDPEKRKNLLNKAELSFRRALSEASNPLFKSSLESIIHKIRPLNLVPSIVLLIFVSILSSLFFLSMNLTGAVTGTAKSDFSFLGIILFIAGLITAFIYFRNERKRFEKMGVI